MAGRASNTEPADVLRGIRGFVRFLVRDISSGRSPTVAIDRYRNYCSDPSGNCNCGYEYPVGKEILTIEKESHAYRLNVLLRVLLIVQQLLQQNKHASKRDIYYMHPSLFVEQAVVDRAINNICILLKCSRHHLNVLIGTYLGFYLAIFRDESSQLLAETQTKYIMMACLTHYKSKLIEVPVGKGLVMGWLSFFEGVRKIRCTRSLNTAYPVPVSVEEVKDIASAARYILVVEKETVFQRLANDNFCEKNQSIVITGRGYPDIPTRRFLRCLVDQLHLPVYCLVDSDPYGFDILMTYKFGSMQMAYDAKLIRVPEMRWLGVYPSDFQKYHLPEQCLLPLTSEDKKKIKALLSRCYLRLEVPQWRLELEIMLCEGLKFELEALSVSSLSFLSEEYIPTKIRSGEQF